MSDDPSASSAPTHDDVPVVDVRVYLRELDIEVSEPVLQIDRSRTVDVRFLAMDARASFPDTGAIEFDDPELERRVVLSHDRTAATVRLHPNDIVPVGYRLGIVLPEQHVRLASRTFSIHTPQRTRALRAEKRGNLRVDIVESGGDITVVPEDLEVPAHYGACKIEWHLQSQTMVFDTVGIRVLGDSNDEFDPDTRSSKVVRLKNKNATIKNYKYEIRLRYAWWGTSVLVFDPTIKNGSG